MKEIRRILVPTDFSEYAESAISLGTRLSRALGAELHVLHAMVLHEADPDDAEDLREMEALSHRASGRADRLLAKLADGNKEECELFPVKRRGIAIAPTTLDYCREEQIDLIVMATHGRRGIRRWVIGSVAEEVVRHAECPVLTVHPSFDLDRNPERLRILAPIDFSSSSKAAAGVAAELAQRLGANLELFHVLAPPAGPALYEGYASYAFDERLEKAAREDLQQLASELARDGLSPRCRVATGYPTQQIVERARGFHLIVIGSRGLSGFSRALVGSTTERVVRISETPVLTLRMQDMEAEADDGIDEEEAVAS